LSFSDLSMSQAVWVTPAYARLLYGGHRRKRQFLDIYNHPEVAYYTLAQSPTIRGCRD